MSKRDTFYDSLVFNGYKLALPADEAERKQFTRSLFGARLIGCVDVLIEEAEKIVAGQAEFVGFTAEQKEKALALVSHNANGLFYWQCVKMDNFPGADLEMSVRERNNESEQRSTLIAGPTEEELHHSYFDWAEQFGDHYDEDSGTRFSLGLTAETPEV